jgi:hypothetical protein
LAQHHLPIGLSQIKIMNDIITNKNLDGNISSEEEIKKYNENYILNRVNTINLANECFIKLFNESKNKEN